MKAKATESFPAGGIEETRADPDAFNTSVSVHESDQFKIGGKS
jgi:hypothetical protein